MASKISISDKGSFLSQHNDCSNNHVIIGDDYRVVRVPDWEMAYAAPWEIFGSYPQFIASTP
jgi:aminoglycoside phosphotransferase (APT) family kinase protein